MRLNFATGLLAGILLASVLVVGSSYSHGASLSGLVPAAEGGVQYSTAKTSTVTSSSTTQTATTTAASTIRNGTVPTLTAPISNLSASVAGSSSNASSQAGVNYVFAPAGQPPSSLATIANRPGWIPLLLLPIAAALALGLILYQVTRPKE